IRFPRRQLLEFTQTPKAEEEQLEYVRGRIFSVVEYRTIKCRGALIRISDPKAAKGTKPYLDLRDITQDAEYTVSAGA
ncbi:hypothetical protein GX48_08407, partial [Paracoccidioides brasiliensis]